MLREPGLAPYFQCVLTQPGTMVELTILGETTDYLSPDERAVIAKRLQNRIKATIGITAAVDIKDPGAIERSVGKARRIVDMRGKAG